MHMSQHNPVPLDAAIIGAGIAGLTVAAYLAREGLAVRVYEQHSKPGGYISSFSREGYTFPAGPTSFGSNGVVFPILQEIGLRDKLEFAPIRHQMSWGNEDVLFDSPAQARDALGQAFPHEKGGLRRFFRWVEVGARGFREMSESGLMLSSGRNVWRQVLPIVLHNPLYPWATGITRGKTNHDLYARFFRDAKLREMLGRLGYPVMGGPFTLGMWASYFCDYYMPRGGMQGVADLLSGYVQEQGGQVHCGERVERILVNDRRATGIRLASGREVRARWVVSAADMHRTFLELVGRQHLSPLFVHKLQQGAPSESIFALFLGLDDSPEIATGLGRFQGSHLCYNGADGGYFNAVLLSKDDPTLAPAGKHALWVGQFSPYEEWAGLSGDEYRQRKQEATESLLGRVEELIPNLRAHIEVVEGASPLTYERYTGNWYGAMAGWNARPGSNPQIDLARELSVKRLYCVGHWTYSPGGVPSAMATAWYTAQEILRRAGGGTSSL